MISLIPLDLILKKLTKELLPTAFQHFKSPLGNDKHSLSRIEIFQNKQTFCKKPTPMYTTQYPDLYINYQEGFNMQTGNKNPIVMPEQNEQISQESMSSKLVYNTLLNRYSFPPLNNSNSFGAVDYDVHVNTKIDYSINHVFKSMSLQELNTLHYICELERTQLLTILAMSVQNPQLAGFLLTGNRSNFLYVEGSTAWLYDCPHFLSPLYEGDKCFDRIPIYYRDTVMFIDPITRQTFNYATPISCDNNPQNVIALDPDLDEHYVLTPKPVLRANPKLFKPNQIQTAISPNTFTAQDAGIYSNAELTNFWNRVLFTKHSDTTLKLLGKAISYDFLASSAMHPENYRSSRKGDNPYGVLRIGLHDQILNLAPLFAPDWFADAFIALFGFPCYILTQCGIYFSTFLFLQTVFSFLLKFLKSISMKYKLHENITFLASFAYGFLNITSPKMVTELHDVECEKRRRNGTLKTFNDNPPEYPNFNSWKTRTVEMNKHSEIMPKISEYNDTINPLLTDKSQYLKTENEKPIAFQTNYELKSTISDPKYTCTTSNLQRSNFAENSPQTFTKTNFHP